MSRAPWSLGTGPAARACSEIRWQDARRSGMLTVWPDTRFAEAFLFCLFTYAVRPRPCAEQQSYSGAASRGHPGGHMATKVQTEESIVEHSPTANLETDLALEFLRVVEEAAIASAKTMGQGDRKHADQMATEAMRGVMDSVPMDGTIVIGEGERDEAPMLYIGEKVGKRDGGTYPGVDIAVDPLEGTNLCATGSPGAITVLAASEHGGLLHAPDCYMEKIVVGPSCKGVVDLEAPVSHNLHVIAKVLNRSVEDLVIIILDRPRHESLINEIRKAGARIRLISDGDLSPGGAAASLLRRTAAWSAGRRSPRSACPRRRRGRTAAGPP